MFCCMCLLVETAQVHGDDTHSVVSRPTMPSEHGPHGGGFLFVGLVVEERDEVNTTWTSPKARLVGWLGELSKREDLGLIRPATGKHRKETGRRPWSLQRQGRALPTAKFRCRSLLPTRRTTKFPQKFVPMTRRLCSWIPTTTMAQWIRQERKHPTAKTEAASVEAAATTEATDAKKSPKSGTVSASGAASTL